MSYWNVDQYSSMSYCIANQYSGMSWCNVDQYYSIHLGKLRWGFDYCVARGECDIIVRRTLHDAVSLYVGLSTNGSKTMT
jgi:hypothetical protein